ncbi:MAG: exosortase-associated protein EpsI, V-type [Sphingomonadales bacterium]
MTDPDVSSINRRNIIIGGALVAASGLAYARKPSIAVKPIKKGQLDTMLPSNVGPWSFQSSSGLVLPPPDALSDRLYDEVSTRVYTAQGRPPVMLLIAYSNLQDGMLQIHRPEVCYPVGGFKLSDSQIIDVPLAANKLVTCRFFTAESAARTEQVLYWTRIGRMMPGEWIEQRWAVVDANLRGEIPDGLLVRMSMVVPDPKMAFDQLTTFARELTGEVSPPMRTLLIGA